MGPLGMVYCSDELIPTERNRLARELANSAKIPLVLVADGPGRLRAWTEEGEFVLPEENKKIIGPSHPFLDEVTRDLIELCHHPDAGDFVICGWRTDATPYSFPMENGSHGGPGSEETRAFALLPADIALPECHGDHLRPMDLRHATLYALGRSEHRISMKPKRKTAAGQTLRQLFFSATKT